MECWRETEMNHIGKIASARWQQGGGAGGAVGEAGGEVMRGRTECFLKCCALSNGSEKWGQTKSYRWWWRWLRDDQFSVARSKTGGIRIEGRILLPFPFRLRWWILRFFSFFFFLFTGHRMDPIVGWPPDAFPTRPLVESCRPSGKERR